MNGNGKKYASKPAIIVSRTSPAKMLPNNRKDNETSLAISEMISRKPTPNSIKAVIIAIGPLLNEWNKSPSLINLLA